MAHSSDPAKAALWRKRLERLDSSSASVARFCRRERVTVTSFYHWRKKQAAGTDPPMPGHHAASQPCAFQPVMVAPISPAIAVHLPDGTRLEVSRGDIQTVRVITGTLCSPI